MTFIKIAERLRPFSHTPGIKVFIPKTSVVAHVFPTRISIGEQVFDLPFKGPIQLTVLQDLERGCICVFGQMPSGFMRYTVMREDEGVGITFEKPVLEKIFIPLPQPQGHIPTERLSLGMHKSQEWEMICRRGDLREIFPVWLRLGGILPPVDEYPFELRDGFINLFRAYFEGILIPRRFDEQYQGLTNYSFPQDLSPLFLLKQGSDLIRSLFFREQESSFSLLPQLFPEFHAGRFVDLVSKKGHKISMEWSKKLLRRVCIQAACQDNLSLVLQKDLKTFRLRRSLRERGHVLKRDDLLSVDPHETIYLDRFQK